MENYVPAIIAKYQRQHEADEQRIKKVVKVDLNLSSKLDRTSNELNKLVNGFVYGGSKYGND